MMGAAIYTIARRELRAYFISPLAWVVLAGYQFISAFMFLASLEFYAKHQAALLRIDHMPGVTALIVAPHFHGAAMILFFTIPILSMHLIADERRYGTISLLYCSPVSLSDIVLGKYLGLLGLLAIVLAMTILQPLSLMVSTPLDLGQFFACILGLGLFLGTLAAVGLFFSTITSHAAAAGFMSFACLLFLWMADSTSASPGALTEISIMNHLRPFMSGIINSADVAYFIIMSCTFLVLARMYLGAERRDRE